MNDTTSHITMINQETIPPEDEEIETSSIQKSKTFWKFGWIFLKKYQNIVERLPIRVLLMPTLTKLLSLLEYEELYS